jgi:hypothetical protein
MRWPVPLPVGLLSQEIHEERQVDHSATRRAGNLRRAGIAPWIVSSVDDLGERLPGALVAREDLARLDALRDQSVLG